MSAALAVRLPDVDPVMDPESRAWVAALAADDAVMGVLARLADFRGLSRFTTWAYKFALLEAATRARRMAWRDRELPRPPEDWLALAAPDGHPEAAAEHAELLARRAARPRGAGGGCDECFAELDRYVELELAGTDPDAQLPGLRAHLAGCLACREEHQSLRDLLSGDGR